jgi:hypothetical protein
VLQDRTAAGARGGHAVILFHVFVERALADPAALPSACLHLYIHRIGRTLHKAGGDPGQVWPSEFLEHFSLPLQDTADAVLRGYDTIPK